MNIPPVFFYAVGSLLVLLGALRLFHFGWRRSHRDLAEDSPARRSQRRQHIIGGALWVLLGAFLLLSTAGVIRLQF